MSFLASKRCTDEIQVVGNSDMRYSFEDLIYKSYNNIVGSLT